MFIYFDRHGVIKETINDEGIRQGDYNSNTFYFYFEELDGIPSITFEFFNSADRESEISTEEFITDTEERKIPRDKKRDLKYFKDFKEYEFYKYTLENIPQNADIGKATIRIVDGENITAYGTIVFGIEESVIKIDHGITQSQFDYLLTQLVSQEISGTAFNNATVEQIGNSIAITLTRLSGQNPKTISFAVLATVIDNLTSTATTYPLSANQGRVLKGLIDTIDGRVTTAEADIADIEDKIPSQASSENKLADKNFVNSSIATETAHPLGSLDLVTDLELTLSATDEEIVEALNEYDFESKTNNDYVYVGTPNATVSTNYDKWTQYKWNSTLETFNKQFDLNNSSFTSAQWSAINSGITAGLVTSFSGHISDTDNPHNVTKSQVGLGNVDNTSDTDKPISNATQQALDGKVNNSDVSNTYVVLDGDPATSIVKTKVGNRISSGYKGSYGAKDPDDVIDVQYVRMVISDATQGTYAPNITGDNLGSFYGSYGFGTKHIPNQIYFSTQGITATVLGFKILGTYAELDLYFHTANPNASPEIVHYEGNMSSSGTFTQMLKSYYTQGQINTLLGGKQDILTLESDVKEFIDADYIQSLFANADEVNY